MENEAKEDWTGLKFSPDGKMIMITTNGSSITLIDSFKGTLVHILKGLFKLFKSFDNCSRQEDSSNYSALRRASVVIIFDDNGILQTFNAM